MTSPSRLTGKIAVVTGAGAGIGRAISLRLAGEGAQVLALDFNATAAQAMVDEIHAAGGQAEAVLCDVPDLESVRAALESRARLDILVNNAGIAHIGTVEQTTPEDLDRIYRVNVKGIYHCLHLAVPKMRSQGGGVILNLASIVAKVGVLD